MVADLGQSVHSLMSQNRSTCRLQSTGQGAILTAQHELKWHAVFPQDRNTYRVTLLTSILVFQALPDWAVLRHHGEPMLTNLIRLPPTSPTSAPDASC